MTLKRYEIKDNPNIIAIITDTGSDVGFMTGERFSIQKNSSSSPQDMPMQQIAEFLNLERNKRKTKPKEAIPEEVEKSLVKDLSDHLTEVEGQYVYIGPLNPNAKKYYGASSYVALTEANEERDNLINLANSNLQIENIGKFTPEEARGVAQRELVMANLDSQKPILGTFGAGPCVAIAVYNPTTHKAMLSHVDALTDLSSLRRYLDIIAQDSKEKLQVHLAGGQESSKEVCTKIIKMLNDRDDNTIKSSKLIPLGGSGESLAIDARTGEVFTSFNPNQLDLGTDFDSKNQLLGLQTSISPIKFVDYEKKSEAVKDKESEGGLVAKLSTKLEPEKSDIKEERGGGR